MKSRDTRRNFSAARTLFAASFIALASCATVGPPDINQAVDFSSTGFIDDGTLQVIVVASADKSARGLVARRESAKNNAEKNFPGLAAGAIADFRLGRCQAEAKNPGQRSADVRNSLLESSRVFLGHGKRVAEYYREDESLVIIFRIAKNGIRSDINALKCEISSADQTDKKSNGGSR